MENVDIISQDGISGAVANELQKNQLNVGLMRPFIGNDGKAYATVYSGKNPNDPKSYSIVPLQTNATLRRDEWKQLDDAVLMASRERLVGINALESRGLIFNLGNAMGTTVLEYSDMDDNLSAELSMDGITRSKNDRPDFGTKYLPIPIIHVDYQINTRALNASRNMGNGIDTIQAEQASRRVAEKLEDMLFTNTTYTFGGGSIYSYVNHPNRNPQTLTLAWDNPSKTGALILADVLAMKAKQLADNKFGPWELYVPTAYDTILDNDFSATSNGVTIRERLLKIEGLSGIKVVDRLAANNVLMVQMTTDVVRLVKGLAIQNIEWQTEGKFVNNYKVITIQVPQIRADKSGKSGIVHLA